MKNKKIYIVIVAEVFLALAAVGYFVLSTNKTAEKPSNNNKGSLQEKTSGVVNMQDFAFSPVTTIVGKGDTVTWTNNDSAAHHVVADNGSFDLGNQDSGATVKFTFTKLGVFNYHCSIHSSMKGTVIVK